MIAKTMRHDTLSKLSGGSGIHLSKLSLGTAPLAGLFRSVTDSQAISTVECALENGVNYFDTAPYYGAGRAERRLGRALQGVARDTFVVSTKVGRSLVPTENADLSLFADGDPSLRDVFDFSAAAIEQSLEESLERLGLDFVDIAYIHDPDDHLDQAVNETYSALEEMKQKGLIRAIGVGVNQAGVSRRFIYETAIDVVLVAGRYTLLDQSAEEFLLPEALKRGISVVIAGVFNSGVLVQPDSNAFFNYTTAPSDVVNRALEIQHLLNQEHQVPLSAAAIQFPLRHPAVTSVLVGCRTADELLSNVESFNVDIPPECWQSLQQCGFVTTSASARTDSSAIDVISVQVETR